MKVIVETPRGSHEKMKFEPEQHQFVVKKMLPGEMRFPFDFGFLPGTLGEDGDPLDVLILSPQQHAIGTTLECSIIGCLPARQTNANGITLRNDRFVAVTNEAGNYSSIASITQLPEDQLDSFQSFFINYLAAENKQVTFLPVADAAEAANMIDAGILAARNDPQ